MAGRDFQALQELVALIQNNSVRGQDVFRSGNGNGKVEELFEGIGSERFTSDEMAALFFYKGNKNGSSYQKLRQTLYRRLVNAVFLLELDPDRHSERQLAYHESYREWAAARIILGKQGVLSGIRLSQKILQKARKFELTELTLQILRVLRTHFGTQVGDSRQFEQYKQLYREYLDLWLHESDAEEWYTELVLQHLRSKADRMELLRQAEAYYARLQEPLRRYDSYQLLLCAGLIRLFIAETKGDQQHQLEVCNDIIRQFEQKPYQATVPLQVAYYQKLICHTQLKQYEEGALIAEKCRKLLQEGSFNWFKFQELSVFFLLHTHHYQEAYLVFEETVRHPKVKVLSPANQEIWELFKGFLAFLLELEKIRPIRGDTQLTRFRMGRMLNETPIFSHDKRGMNIPLLLIQILFTIRQGKYETAIHRIEAIEKYSSRYLRRDETFRSNCFIKMLLAVPKSGFHRPSVVRKTNGYLAQLRSVPLSLSGQAHEIEIIPYEDLWEMVLENLSPVSQ